MNLKTYTGLILTWIVSLIAIYALAYQLGYIEILPNTKNLILWDANYYNSIRLRGYEYIHMQGCNAGFFPLFAMLWWLIGDSAVWVSIINIAILIVALRYLVQWFQPNKWEVLLVLSLPPMLFFYVPYSESLFFFFSTLILIGLKQSNNYLVAFAIFFASLTRPSFLFFVPAFGCLFLIEVNRDNWWPLLKKYFIYYAIPTILALAVLIIVQKLQTDTWFAYFRAQRNVWSRHIRFPRLPYGTLEGRALLWIEAISFWLGMIVIILSTDVAKQFFKARDELLKRYDRTYLFSLIYLLMSFFSILFFNPIWEINRTLLNGINRYMFANPFIFVFLWKVCTYVDIKKMHLQWLFPFSFVVWLMVDFYYLDVWGVPYFLGITTYLFLMVYYFKNRNQPLFYLLFLINACAQIYLFQRFINNLWVG